MAARQKKFSSVIDGFGFITNPVGSCTQLWHIDYTHDSSSIFEPMTPLLTENAMQYCVLPSDTPIDILHQAVRDLDSVDLATLARADCDYSVRQAISCTFSLMRLQYATIHRGVSNRASQDRVMFYISVKKSSDLLPLEVTIASILSAGSSRLNLKAISSSPSVLAIAALTNPESKQWFDV